MTYFRDLSPCTDVPLSDRVLAVGWLAADEPFETGTFPDELVACLLCRPPELHSCGTHWCDLCLPTANRDEFSESPQVAGGSRVFLVEGVGGITYAAPDLIVHYIRAHNYAPPEQFTAALRAWCARRSAAHMRMATRRYAYVRASEAFDQELGDLGIAFTHPAMEGQRLIFYDLRAKSKFGRLEHVRDVEAILRHRAPGLSGAGARAAAAEVWAAWHRFLDHEDFGGDWLQLSGPQRHP